MSKEIDIFNLIFKKLKDRKWESAAEKETRIYLIHSLSQEIMELNSMLLYLIIKKLDESVPDMYKCTCSGPIYSRKTHELLLSDGNKKYIAYVGICLRCTLIYIDKYVRK